MFKIEALSSRGKARTIMEEVPEDGVVLTQMQQALMGQMQVARQHGFVQTESLTFLKDELGLTENDANILFNLACEVEHDEDFENAMEAYLEVVMHDGTEDDDAVQDDSPVDERTVTASPAFAAPYSRTATPEETLAALVISGDAIDALEFQAYVLQQLVTLRRQAGIR